MKLRQLKLTPIIAGMLGALLLSESAFALSCARPDLVGNLETAKASPDIYYILVGKFRPVTPKQKQYKLRNHRLLDQVDITPSLFDGYSIAKTRRQDQALSGFPLDIETTCTGPWCSRAPALDQEMIAIVQARPGQTPILRTSPCPSKVFRATTKSIEKLRECLDQSCEGESRDRLQLGR